MTWVTVAPHDGTLSELDLFPTIEIQLHSKDNSSSIGTQQTAFWSKEIITVVLIWWKVCRKHRKTCFLRILTELRVRDDWWPDSDSQHQLFFFVIFVWFLFSCSWITILLHWDAGKTSAVLVEIRSKRNSILEKCTRKAFRSGSLKAKLLCFVLLAVS